MLAKKCFLVGIFTLFSLSLAVSAQPVNPATGEPLMMDCLRGTPDAIDGDLSDWNLEAMTPAVLDAVEQLSSGQDIWTGPEDCSGKFYMMWDDVNIYMAVVVKDDKLVMNKTDGSIWNSDCVEMFFATTDAEAEHPWTNPTIHYQYGFNANNQTWNWCNMDGPGQSVPDYLQVASSVTADGYICEASIEYGQMLALDFSAGNTIGIHPCIDDTDIDDGDTEYQMSWTGLPAHDQSMGYGHMLLSADSVPEPEPVDPGTEGLVAHYAFENDANDSSGNGHNGTIMGDPQWVAGMNGMALDFDGTEDYIDIGLGADDYFATLNSGLTVAAWVSRESTGTYDIVFGAGRDPVGTTAGDDNNGWKFGIDSGDVIKFTTLGILDYTSSVGVPLGEWAHIAATFNEDGTEVQIYLDGTLADTISGNGPANPATGLYAVGFGGTWELEFFDGMLDDVMIYNRVLSEAEVRYLAGERPVPVNPGSDGLVAYYELENDANDSSGNGLDGTIVGDPMFVEGAIGMGLQLDGVDDYVDLGNDPLFDLTEQVTLSLWVNTQDIGNTQNNPWLGKGDTSYMIKGHREGNQIEFFIYDGTWITAHADVGPEFNGEWHHAAGTYDGQQLIIYVDGEVAVTSDHVGGITPNTYDVAIGTNTQAGGRFSESIIDEAIVYNRALSAGEIRYLAGFRSYTYDGDALDDTWDHDNDSDAWDGTGPGEGSPGGAAALVEDGVTFLRIQDTGDPRDYGFSDPSNRKIYLTHQIDTGLDGAHMEFRLRVATTPPLDDMNPDGGAGVAPWPDGGIGYHIRDGGKGMIGIAEGGGTANPMQISFSLAKAGEPGFEDLTTDVLVMNSLGGTEANEDTVDTDDGAIRNVLAIDDATAWNTIVVDIAPGGAGTHIVTVSVNGGPAVSFDVTAGNRCDEDGNYIAIGSSGTGGITAFDVDYVMVSN